MTERRTASSYLEQAKQLRHVAIRCFNPSLKVEMLDRAAELEELAAWASEEQGKLMPRQINDQLTAPKR